MKEATVRAQAMTHTVSNERLDRLVNWYQKLLRMVGDDPLIDERDAVEQLAIITELQRLRVTREAPKDWVMVPREATAEMLKAGPYGFSFYGGIGGAYRAMIEAAPLQPQQEVS